MSKIDKVDQKQYTDLYQQLIENQRTLLLSTVSSMGKPECSYAPYVRDSKGLFYIFVSNLALHTQNLLKNPVCSILFIQAENQTKNLFARERVVLDCTVNRIQSEDSRYEEQLIAMKKEFGETVDLLRGLPDFNLLSLTVVSGRFIAGFGQAFPINPEDGTLIFNYEK